MDKLPPQFTNPANSCIERCVWLRRVTHEDSFLASNRCFLCSILIEGTVFRNYDWHYGANCHIFDVSLLFILGVVGGTSIRYVQLLAEFTQIVTDLLQLSIFDRNDLTLHRNCIKEEAVSKLA